jgi:hypothetical protein
MLLPRGSWSSAEERDKRLLLALERLGKLKAVAEEFGMSYGAARAWLRRVRKKRERFQQYLAWQNDIVERSSFVRKLLSRKGKG